MCWLVNTLIKDVRKKTFVMHYESASLISGSRINVVAEMMNCVMDSRLGVMM